MSSELNVAKHFQNQSLPIFPIRKFTPLFGILILLLVSSFAGCTTRSNAKQQARAAYTQGQQQAQRMLQVRTSVTLIGAVHTPMIPWTEDLTVAKALIIAGYYGKGTPSEILLVRNGQAQRVEPEQLLAGNDVPLFAGDLIQIR
jgi:hypothetical protein